MSYEGDLVASYDAVHKRLLNGHPKVKTAPPLVQQPPVDKNSLGAILLRLSQIEEQVKWLEFTKTDKRRKYPHNPPYKYLNVDEIFQLVVKKEQYQPCLIMSSQRQADLVQIRHIIFYLAATQTKKSLAEVARYMDRDHTTIMHGKRKIAKQRLEDKLLDQDLLWYEAEIARLTEAKNKP